MKKFIMVFTLLLVCVGGSLSAQIWAAMYSPLEKSYYFWDKTGQNYVMYDGVKNTLSQEYNTAKNLGDGKGPFSSVVAAFYNDIEKGYYFFTGTEYVILFNDKKWSPVYKISSLGDGKIPFASVTSAFWSPQEKVFYFFDETGTKYITWDGTKKAWSKIYSSKANLGDGKIPFDAIGCAVYVPDENSYYFWNAACTQFTRWDAAKRTWDKVRNNSELAGGQLKY